MGNRISIAFRNGKEESVTLFSHWGGIEFRDKARDYVRDLNVWLKQNKQSVCSPLDRKEPCYVMVDFIRHITKDMDKVESDLYLGKDEMEGDNSDNGHHIIDL
jgi:hypothetical protein